MVVGDASAIYECRVMHRRLTPQEHQFEYRVFYLWLDLDEVDATASRLRWFSHNRFNLYSFHDRDHLDLGRGSAKANLLAWLEENKAPETSRITHVRLLAFPRIFGHVFNPVCFFYCYEVSGEPVCVVAQVTNTFREQKPYVALEREGAERFRLITPKHFYVSPFSELEVSFDFKLGLPGEHLEIHIDDREGDRRLLLSSLTGARRELSDARLLWFILKYPVLTLRVIFLIHWHALRLWLKRIPCHRKSARPDLQQGVLNPHRSIAQQTTPP